MTSMKTPRAWSKLEEAIFFLDHLRREHDVATASSERAFAFYLSAFLNAAFSLIELLPYEAKNVLRETVGADAFDRWLREFLEHLSADDRTVWEFLRAQRRAEVHLLEGAQMLSDERRGIPLEGTDAVGGTQPAFYRTLLSAIDPPWDEAQMRKLGLPPWTTAWREAPVHHFKIEGERREVVQVCATYVGLLRRLLEEFHASPLARDA